MALPFDQINFLAVLVGGVINMAVGFVWYGPLFGKLWLRLIGKTNICAVDDDGPADFESIQEAINEQNPLQA